jgi:hypothetical protein
VAVIAGVANLGAAVIVALMAGAFFIVALSEWLAARAQFVSPASGFVGAEMFEPAPPVEPAPTVQPAAWGVEDSAVLEPLEPVEPADSGEPDEETEPEALTVVGAPAVDPWEAGAEAEPVSEETAGHGFFRRRRR